VGVVQCRGPLPVGEACDCIRQAALGLHHAHERGIVHRDVKPSNLLLTAQAGVVKVLDLGLARRAGTPGAEESAPLTQHGAIMGTPDYMAPEQADNSHEVDGRADIYSLGCSFYTMLTGQPPFPGRGLIEKLVLHQTREPTPIEQLRGGVPPEVGEILRRMMAKSPDDRFASALEVAEALTPLCVGVKPAAPWFPGGVSGVEKPSSTPRIERHWQAHRPHSRRLRVALALTMGTVLLIAGLQFALHFLPWSNWQFASPDAEAVGVPPSGGGTVQFPDTPPEGGTSTVKEVAVAAGSPDPATRPDRRSPVDSEAHRAAAVTRSGDRATTGTPEPLLVKRESTSAVPFSLPSPALTPALPDLLHRFQGGERIRCVAFDSRLESGPAFSCGEYALRQWDLKEHKQLPELRIDKYTDQLIWSVACSFDGRYAVCGTGGFIKNDREERGSDNWLLLIDRESQSVRGSFRRLDGKEGHADSVVSVAFAPDGCRVASGSFDRTVRVWNVATRREICTCRGHLTRVRCVAFPPRSGEVLASGDQAGTVALWDATTGKRLELLEGHTDAVTCVVFSPDGRRLASASVDGTVRLWNRDDVRDERIFRGHGAPVRSVAFLPDGERLLSGGDDGVLRLWSANNLQEIRRFAGHTKAVNSVAVSADGRQALSGGDDRSVILWSLPAVKP
jgi:WD40 repeat protein